MQRPKTNVILLRIGRHRRYLGDVKLQSTLQTYFCHDYTYITTKLCSITLNPMNHSIGYIQIPLNLSLFPFHLLREHLAAIQQLLSQTYY